MAVDRQRARDKGMQGLPELLKKLNDMRAPETINTIAFRGTFGASKDIRDLARANSIVDAPPISHGLEKNWAIKRIVVGTQRGYTIGVRTGNKRTGDLKKGKNQTDDPYYWWYIEFGTPRIAPKGFFRRAIKSLEGKSLTTIQKAGLKAVMRSANSALRRFGNGKAKPK